MNLAEELGLRRGFQHPSHEALLNIYHTAARIKKAADVFFRAYGLTDVQFNLLMLLAHQTSENEGLTQVELSRMMLVNRANITSLVDRMEKAKLVMRTPTPHDRRYNIVRLTERGRRLLTQVDASYHETVEKIMQALSPSEVKTLTRMLERIRANFAPEIESESSK